LPNGDSIGGIVSIAINTKAGTYTLSSATTQASVVCASKGVLQVKVLRHVSLVLTLIAVTSLVGCEKSEKSENSEKAGSESANLQQLREALPGARVEPLDPEQLKKLGPSAVPGILRDSELSLRQARALGGDGAAAYDLYHHYKLVGREEESQFWARIGAENGEYNSMMLAGFASGKEDGLEGCMRAVYWFRRARGELEADLASGDAGANRDGIEALLRSVDEEITSVKQRVAGC
jgi:hypothetical protein